MLTGSITIQTNWIQTPTNVPGALPAETRLPLTWNVASGTSADQADQKYSLKKTVAASTPWELDLTTLTDAQGIPISPARIKALIVHNLSTIPGQVVLIGYAAATPNTWTAMLSNPGQLTLHPSTAAGSPGVLVMVAPGATGFAVDATHKLIPFDPGTNTIAIELELICASV